MDPTDGTGSGDQAWGGGAQVGFGRRLLVRKHVGMWTGILATQGFGYFSFLI